MIILAALTGLVTPVWAKTIDLDGQTIPDLATVMMPLESDQGLVIKDRLWRSISLRNATQDTQVWRLQSEILFPTSFEIFVQENGKTELLFSTRYPLTPQKTRASQGKLINSWPLVIDAGETVTLVAGFARGAGIPDTPILLIEEQRFDSTRQRLSYLHGWYIGAAFVFLIFFIVFSVLLSSQPARYYAIYFTALVILNLHSYGYAESLFYSGAQWLYFPLFRLLQVFIMLAYLGFALSFLKSAQHHPRLHRWTRIYIALTAALAFLEALFWNPLFVLIVDMMALGFLLIGLATACLAVRRRLDGARFFAVGYGLLLLTGVINYVASNPDAMRFNNQVDAATLSLQVSDALVFAAAMVSQTFGLRRERDAALEAELGASEEKVRALEERDRAHRLADSFRGMIASTSHDLRQPLASLTLALDRLEEETPGKTEDLRTGIAYLRSIIDEASAEAGNETEYGSGPPDTQTQATEHVPVQIIFDNVIRMFGDEAAQKGLSLKAVGTRFVVQIPPVILIRMVSNLVSNAIKYTKSGGVRIGIRRIEGRYALAVYDTGPGMAREELNDVMEAYRRGATSDGIDGDGLGLAITGTLAQGQGLALVAYSKPGSGSVFFLSGLGVVDHRPAPEKETQTEKRPEPARVTAPAAECGK